MMEAISASYQNQQSGTPLQYYDRNDSTKFADEKRLFHFVAQTNEINKQKKKIEELQFVNGDLEHRLEQIASAQQEEIFAQRKELELHYGKIFKEQTRKHTDELELWKKKYEAEKLQRIASEETSRRTLKEMVGFIHNHKKLTPQQRREDLVKAEKIVEKLPSVDEDRDRVRTAAIINNLSDFFGL